MSTLSRTDWRLRCRSSILVADFEKKVESIYNNQNFLLLSCGSHLYSQLSMQVLSLAIRRHAKSLRDTSLRHSKRHREKQDKHQQRRDDKASVAVAAAAAVTAALATESLLVVCDLTHDNPSCECESSLMRVAMRAAEVALAAATPPANFFGQRTTCTARCSMRCPSRPSLRGPSSLGAFPCSLKRCGPAFFGDIVSCALHSYGSGMSATSTCLQKKQG